MFDSIRRAMNKSPFWSGFVVFLPLFYILDLILSRTARSHSPSLSSSLLGISIFSALSALFCSFIGYIFHGEGSPRQ